MSHPAPGAVRTRPGASPLSVGLLIAANLVPLAGVAFLGWSLLDVLVLFWVESGIVGLCNVPKILMARGPFTPTHDHETGKEVEAPPFARNRWALVPFFLLHYGVFWVVHGFLVFALPGFSKSMGALLRQNFRFVDPVVPPSEQVGVGFGGIDVHGLVPAAGMLAVSHLVSFAVNFVGRREYLRMSPWQQTMSVYDRVTVLHLTILQGGVLAGILGAPLVVLLILVLLKTSVDLKLHLRERRKAGAAGD